MEQLAKNRLIRPRGIYVGPAARTVLQFPDRRIAGEAALAGREVFFEFARLGAYVRVAAIDADSGVEVVVMGPAHAAQADLERLALQKLDRKLADGGMASPRRRPAS